MWWLTLIPVALYSTLLTHELSHWAVLRAEGVSVTEFKAWPHRRDDGRVWLGWVGWKGSLPRPARVAFYLAPMIKALMLGMCWAGLTGLVEGPGAWVCAAGWAGEWFQALWWWVGFFRKGSRSDGRRIREIIGGSGD